MSRISLSRCEPKRSRGWNVLAGATLSLALLSPVHAQAPTSGDYIAIPPFIAANTGKPNVVIALDISGSMKTTAYRDTGAGNWKTGLHDDFNPAVNYFGYFDGLLEDNTYQKYSYDGTNGFFYRDAAGSWDGNFLNWLAMRRIDVARKVLVGGKVRDRAGEVMGGQTWYILEGQNEPADYSYRKSYSGGSTLTPFPDDQEFTIADGYIKPTANSDAFIVAVTSNLELGRVTMDWNTFQYNPADPTNPALSDWKTVAFQNTYTDPVVVATAVSYEGGDPTVARVRNVTTSGFEVRLQEWDHKDGNHTTEDIVYIVAEKGAHTSIMTGSGNLEFVAGKVENTNAMSQNALQTVLYNSPSGHTFGTTPVVFHGVSTHNEPVTANDDYTVVSRIQNVGVSSFRVGLQEQENNYTGGSTNNALTGSRSHAPENIHYVAIKPVTDVVQETGVPIEIGTENNVDDSWHTMSFTTTFATTPLVGLSMQTTNGENTASVRFGNNVQTESQLDIQIDEEQSADSETDHVNENVGYFAAPGTGFRILLGELEEPLGLLQNNSAGMRFGLAVYNYDHTRSPTSIYTGNKVDGGTMYPCYPDLANPPSARTNYDICVETHVKAPLQDIIDVIEDHPLVWGTTPIAETLYEIFGYVRQNGGYYYDNGTETDHPGLYPSYEISSDWDPYYYDAYSAKLPCAKTFVLHFNDGAPYEDWQTSNPATTHPAITGDGVGSTGKNEMLDDVAYHIRKNDCRSDIGEHQEIISYYVYSALGEGESNNNSTARLRQAAANGGFSDADGDHAPDPAHPLDFISYVSGGSCTANEWDDDADCNPDTFYVADNGHELVRELSAALQSILRRASSGGAASVISASSSGEGAIYQGIFQPALIDGAYEVKWTGEINGIFVDDGGNLREDANGDKALSSSFTDDPIIDMCFDAVEKQVRVKLSTTAAARPTEAQIDACSVSIFNKEIFDLNYIWSASKNLIALTDTQAVTQRAYTSTTPGRHMLTGIDSAGGDGLIVAGETVAFVPGSFTDSNAGLLQAADATEAAKIVEYIRGEDQTGYRSRELDGGKTHRLGDIIYSIPTVVGRPAEAFDILYEDTGYATFLQTYRNRRQVVYAGTNDGMLHAFNGGYFNPGTHQFQKGASGDAQYDLGAELWAYIPYNLLPNLKYLTKLDYGAQTGDHLYFVDLKPRVFDAKIFTPGAKHPGGWGTVLVGGMRFGGGTITVDANTTAPGTDLRTMRSSYFILDITDPEGPPTVLLEFTHPNLGFTTAVPAPFVVNNAWYLLLGSGPDATKDGLDAGKSTQPGKLFLLNLNTMALETGFDGDGIYDLPDANSFVSDLVAVDFNLDYDADAVYFGTVSGSATPWSGKLYRLRITNPGTGTAGAVGTWAVTEFLDAGKPIVAKTAFGIDKERNRWVYVGTGRFYTRADSIDTTAQTYYGIKEPRNTSGGFTWAAADGTNMAEVTNSVVEETSRKVTGVSIAPGLPANATFDDLEERMLQFADSTKYEHGWFRSITSGERVIGEATLLGGTLTHTTYTPSSAACAVEGSSKLYAINFTTGTAGPLAIIGTGGTGPGGNAILETTIDLGVAPALTPSLHTGSGYEDEGETKAFIQTSTGKTLVIEQQNMAPVRSGERSWRSLR